MWINSNWYFDLFDFKNYYFFCFFIIEIIHYKGPLSSFGLLCREAALNGGSKTCSSLPIWVLKTATSGSRLNTLKTILKSLCNNKRKISNLYVINKKFTIIVTFKLMFYKKITHLSYFFWYKFTFVRHHVVSLVLLFSL